MRSCVRFNRFFIKLFYPIFPIQDQTLAYFVTWQSQFVKPQTVKQYIFGVRAWQLWNGFTFTPLKERLQVFQALQGIKRYFGTPSKSVMEVTPEIMCKMAQLVDFNDPNSTTVWAAMCLCYYCTLRKDNVTVGKQDAFNPRLNLTNGDLAVDSNTLRGAITIKHSKTNQFFHKTHTIPLVGYGGRVCVISALAKMIRATQGASRAAAQPLFQVKSGSKFVPMSRTFFVESFKKLAKMAGYNPDDYAGHSFR